MFKDLIQTILPDPLNLTISAQAAVDSIPAGKLGTAEDIAKVALFLASDDAQFVHGAAIVADGGKTII